MMFDQQTGTLLAGPVVATTQLPEVRDSRLGPWISALTKLQKLSIQHIVPDYGDPGTAEDIARTIRYLTQLEQRVQELLRRGVSLSAATEAGQLPEFSTMTGYQETHARNIQQIFLRLEDQFFK